MTEIYGKACPTYLKPDNTRPEPQSFNSGTGRRGPPGGGIYALRRLHARNRVKEPAAQELVVGIFCRNEAGAAVAVAAVAAVARAVVLRTAAVAAAVVKGGGAVAVVVAVREWYGF